jgi:hypothetical protein
MLFFYCKKGVLTIYGTKLPQEEDNSLADASEVVLAHHIGANIQVLAGQFKPPHSVRGTCSKLATCA